MNALQVMSTYSEQISAIAAALAANKAKSDEAREANKGRVEGLTEQVREFARVTADAGLPVDEARAGLQAGLTALGTKGGSVKAVGNHFAGFRVLLEQGVDISEKSQTEAQEAVASPDAKRVKRAKSALAAYAKENKWKGADWLVALDVLGIARPAEDQETENVSDDDAEDIRQAANG